jgi:hypothetical protein
MTRRPWFAVTYGVVLAAVAMAATEAVASLFVPPWPARALRSIEPVNANSFKALAVKPWASRPFNTWGMNDRERSVVRPPDISFRSVLVGDSFIESLLAAETVPAAVERLFAAEDRTGIEAINLGVSGTGPRSYFYRLRDVALALSPDALLVFFYAGNDFIAPGDAYRHHAVLPLLDESAGGSLLGQLMPRTNWLVVNRLGLSEALRGNKPIPNEFDTIDAIVHEPPPARLTDLVNHVRRYYFPEMSEQKVAEILSRGGDEFWSALDRRPVGEQYLMGWLLNLMVVTETSDDPIYRAATREQAARQFSADPEVEATMSWLVAMVRMAQARHVPIRLFLIPTGDVDPHYAAFWKPWPRFYSWQLRANAWLEPLVTRLQRASVLCATPGSLRGALPARGERHARSFDRRRQRDSAGHRTDAEVGRIQRLHHRSRRGGNRSGQDL